MPIGLSSSSSSSSSRRNFGTCIDLPESTQRVSPPVLAHGACYLLPVRRYWQAATGGRVLRPSGRVNNLPPPIWCRSLTTPLSLPSLSIAVALFRHLPSCRCQYARFAESSGLTAIAGSALPSSRSSLLLRLSEVPLSPLLLLLPMSFLALPPSGQEKRLHQRPHPRCVVKDGPIIRPRSRGCRHCC